ncbi:PHP domain-containing protein [Maridesulfovibrio sp. FT414]|uniref:PHP domain-containing protein n=1 Tax=Maridesulfovibrio sp. FT414 TaxID=2979469 RepID=UPI003D804082
MNTQASCPQAVKVSPEITDEDRRRFHEVISTELADWQIEQVITPSKIYPRQENLLALHWHPEFVPLDLITRRVDAMFPNARERMMIPTQHNVLMSYGNYTGVEVDCYASGFNQKVQLLLHFENDRVKDAGVLKSMLAHTFKYRSSQLFEYMDTITTPMEDRIAIAARETGADEDLVEMVRVYVTKLQTILDEEWSNVSQEAIKNKLVKNYFDAMRPKYGDNLINRIQAYLKEVKKLVKQNFSLKFFYRATEVIEEARALGGCVVIPHPEEFWPILLAKYDVDGIEVWNPQSQRYTDFLISVVNEQNASRPSGGRNLLIFMGDDCHMSEKTKSPETQDPDKAGREIGLQPAWDDLHIRKKLIIAGIDRHSVISEYRERLAG